MSFQFPPPTRPLKRRVSQTDLVDEREASSKLRKKLQPYHPPPRETVQRWLNEVQSASRLAHSRSDPFTTYDMDPHRPEQISRAESAHSSPGISQMPVTPEATLQTGAARHLPPAFDMRPPSVPLSQITGLSGSYSEPKSDAKKVRRVAIPTYRDDLERHCVFLDSYGLAIPDTIREFAVGLIGKPRTSSLLLEEDLKSMLEIFSSLANADEGSTRKGFDATSLFPTKDRLGNGISVGVGVPWDRAGLPYVHGFNFPPIVQPMPDYQYSYLSSTFDNSEFSAMQHSRLKKYSLPSSAGYWPFFTVEAKSVSRGGTHWIGENQNAGAGAHSVNSLETLLAHARQGTDQRREILDSLAFSCVADINSASLWMHWCESWPDQASTDSPRFFSAKIDSYHLHKPAELRSLWAGVRNIIDFGVDSRLPTIKRALKEVLPQIRQWDVEDRAARVRRRSSDELSISSSRRGSEQE